ncbi:DUF2300 domain-containing protein [Iodobacter fluviatilis]|uniref:Predicted secreted protein n=1 Tax=Iodobacter fluviatilis TaxID=537 RepID=A0A377Q6W5_9NEIS|nr:DUF2300 domain-containing protein [Iodobacter fluviatilis]TCU89642.1 putative secreted protein DUF2300 [Iodobacter fluviatilis]STQ91014.1 Predicted secreted protein [Iodobacter fluviatilis]
MLWRYASRPKSPLAPLFQRGKASCAARWGDVYLEQNGDNKHHATPFEKGGLRGIFLLILLILLFSSHYATASPPCQPLPEIQQRLGQFARGWHSKLAMETGYAPPARYTVCQLKSGLPFADHRLKRIYIRGLASEDDEITLAHEYLHLAFSHHPRGHDEVFIEALARRLVGVP